MVKDMYVYATDKGILNIEIEAGSLDGSYGFFNLYGIIYFTGDSYKVRAGVRGIRGQEDIMVGGRADFEVTTKQDVIDNFDEIYNVFIKPQLLNTIDLCKQYVVAEAGKVIARFDFRGAVVNVSSELITRILASDPAATDKVVKQMTDVIEVEAAKYADRLGTELATKINSVNIGMMEK